MILGNRNLSRLMTFAAAAGFLALATGCGKPAKAREGVADGQDIYERRCAQCHGDDARGDFVTKTPSIAGLDAWYVKAQLEKFRSGVRGTHPDDKGGMRMRPMSLGLSGDEDIAEVSDYVAKLGRRTRPGHVDGDAAKGAELYSTCAACHGNAGHGNEGLSAPPIAGADDWYLEQQLLNYRAGVRGTHPDDITGMQMRPNAVALKNEQEVKDLVAHIRTLPVRKLPSEE